MTSRGTGRIYELSKDLGLDNKDVLDAAEKLSIAAKSHSSSISESEAGKIRTLLKSGGGSKAASAPAKPAPGKAILSVKKAADTLQQLRRSQHSHGPSLRSPSQRQPLPTGPWLRSLRHAPRRLPSLLPHRPQLPRRQHRRSRWLASRPLFVSSRTKPVERRTAAPQQPTPRPTAAPAPNRSASRPTAPPARPQHPHRQRNRAARLPSAAHPLTGHVLRHHRRHGPSPSHRSTERRRLRNGRPNRNWWDALSRNAKAHLHVRVLLRVRVHPVLSRPAGSAPEPLSVPPVHSDPALPPVPAHRPVARELDAPAAPLNW